MGVSEDGSHSSIDDAIGSAKRRLGSGQLAEAEAEYAKIQEDHPENVEAKLGLSIIYGATRRLPDAIKIAREAVRLQPDGVDALCVLAAQLRAAGSMVEAVANSEKAIQADPSNPSGFFNLGVCRLMSREPAKAIEPIQKAISIRPDIGEHYFYLGLAYEALLQPQEALSAFEKAAENGPNIPPHHIKLAQVKAAAGDTGGAIESFYKALKVQRNPGVSFELGKLLMKERRLEEAETVLVDALKLQPGTPQLLELLSNVLREAGKFEEAIQACEQVLKVEPGLGYVYYRIASCKKIGPEDSDFVDRVLERLGTATGPDDLRQLNYAAGKAFNDLKEYEKAIHHYDEANKYAAIVHFRGQELEREQYRRAFTQASEPFTTSFFVENESVGSPSEAPVFIVGMIRSGTTLLEQILSSHPSVAAGGELPFWHTQAAQREMRNGASGTVNAAKVQALTKEYLELLRRIGPEALRVTDKLPTNYMMLGLIHLALPKARIIHCRRNPIDTALSIYTTPFNNPPRFAHDRSNIVFGMQEYARMMDHWRSILPAEVFLEIDYQDLVVDQETTARKVVEFCGLEWDSACLRHEENQNAVQTPSFWQVRQPIYTSSVERWRLYEPWLREFNQLR